MRPRVKWDGRSKRHIAQHKLVKSEIDEVVEGKYFSRKHRGRLILIGRTRDRMLFVVLEPIRGTQRQMRAITARDASNAEKRLFRRKVTK